MATLKHINSKNADYGAAEQYLLFEHDEFTMKPVLDETGRLIPREDYRLSTLNCGGEDFAVACMRANLRYEKNQRREDVKSHHYIISFDPRDGPDNGLTVDRAQALGEQFCKEHFPGHQALVCTHPDGHNHSGNIHVHIVINSLRIEEAFYGIPAVLIAECKSRIDKGLMTDVLDEFDHVLGRSVDTYSDEVDETQANQMIEAAIDQYYIQQDKNGMLLFMEVMVTRMQQAGEVIVPYITENPFMSEEQISKVKAGDTISLDHDVRLKIETVKDADEKEWIGVFTSSEEMHKGSAGNVQMNQSIESILRLALNWEQVNGIVINPFGKYIQMTKKMIELLINGYEYNENERKSKDDENN